MLYTEVAFSRLSHLGVIIIERWPVSLPSTWLVYGGAWFVTCGYLSHHADWSLLLTKCYSIRQM